MSSQGARAYIEGMSYEEAHERFPVEAGNAASDLKPGKIQISREIDAFFRRYEGLAPSMLISCMREAWCPLDPDDADCVDRITFDEDISYVDLFEDASVQRRRVAGVGQVVMEIKCAGGYPLWLSELLSAHGVYPRSFSKYGNAFKRVLASRGSVRVRENEAGKVAVSGVPTAKERAAYADVVIEPSEGYGVEELMLLAS